MQSTNVPQPIKQAVCLPSRRFSDFTRLKDNWCKGKDSLILLSNLLISGIIENFLRQNFIVVFRFLLSILDYVSLIFNRVDLDLEDFRLKGVGYKFLLLNVRLFHYSIISKILHV